MTLFLAIPGQRQKPKLIKLTDTNDTSIIAGPNSGVLTLDTLSWSTKGSGGDLSLWITDGTISAYYMDAETKSGRTHELISDWHPVLPGPSWVLKAKASAGNQFDIIATFVQSGQSGTTST